MTARRLGFSGSTDADAAVLSVDFGTSSLRAAIRGVRDTSARVLEIGHAVASKIDDASIPSAIFVGKDGKVSVGQAALEAGLTGAPSLLFEQSPKRWMTLGHPEDLRRPLAEGLDVTKRDAIAALIGHALSAASIKSGRSRQRLRDCELRIAHPVWGTDREKALRSELRWIRNAALAMCGRTDKPVAAAELAKVSRALPDDQADGTVDVVEPVAAALELFANDANSRQACAVVDVGAGTIDLALLISVTPDESVRGQRRRLIPIAQPRSMPLAGDVIDEEVLALIRDNAAHRLTVEESADLERRRREIKERLFTSRSGTLAIAKTRISMDELTNRPRIRDMARQLGDQFRDLVQSAPGLPQFVGAQNHPVERIDVVFAGGGSEIEFLRAAIPQPIAIRSYRLPVHVQRKPDAPARRLPASLERLAVALGATTPRDEWPTSSWLRPTSFRGLSGIAAND
jgi:hypothetical protein